MSRGPNRQAGLTLVELMVSLVISSIAIAAALSIGYAMMNAYRSQKTAVKIERSARVSLEIIADQIRTASPGVQNNTIADMVGCDPMMTGLTVESPDDAPDVLRVIYPAGGVLTTVATTITSLSSTVDVIDASELAVGDYVVITDLDETAPKGVLVEIADITEGVDVDDPDVITLTGEAGSLCPLASGVTWPGDIAQKAIVIRARMAKYEVVDDATVGNVPTLMVDIDGPDPDSEDPEPVAEGIEDMQIAVGFDINGDGLVAENGANGDDDEWLFNHADDTDPGLPWPETPRAARITLIARAVSEQNEAPTYTRPGAEDRAAATAQDEFRRRVLSSIVEIRNMAGSP